MSPTPNYILTDAVSVPSANGKEYKILTAGTFVTPIQLAYVPKHITDDPQNKYYNDFVETFAYCHLGIVAIPRDKMRQV